MLHIALFLSLSLTFYAGCKSRSFGDVASESVEHTVPKTTLVYHWTTDPLAAINPEEYVFKELRGVAQKNENGKSISPSSKEGAGIYASVDPLASYSFGNILLEIPVQASSRYAIDLPQQNVAIVGSDIPMILFRYSYGGNGPIFQSNLSVVIRSSTVIDLKDVRAYNGQNARRLSEHRKLSSLSLGALLSEYVDHPLLLRHSFKTSPTLLVAAASEIESEVPELKKISEQNVLLLKNAYGCADDWQPRFSQPYLRGCKIKIDSLGSVFYKFLRLYGYVDATTPDSEIEKNVEAKMAADPRNVERIEELKKAVEAIKAEAKNTYTLANWPR